MNIELLGLNERLDFSQGKRTVELVLGTSERQMSIPISSRALNALAEAFPDLIHPSKTANDEDSAAPSPAPVQKEASVTQELPNSLPTLPSEDEIEGDDGWETSETNEEDEED